MWSRSFLWCDTVCASCQDCHLHHIPSRFQAHHWQIHVSESSAPFIDSRQHVEFSHLFHWSFKHTSKCMWAINSLTWWRSWHFAKQRTCWKFPFRISSPSLRASTRVDERQIESNHLLKASQSISKYLKALSDSAGALSKDGFWASSSSRPVRDTMSQCEMLTPAGGSS